MPCFSSLLAVLGGLFTFATGNPVVDSRSTDAAAPFSPASIINALGVGLVKDINAIITLDSLVTNEISINFDVQNPLPIELTLDSVSAVAGLNGTIFATFSHTFPFPGLVVNPLGTKNSGTINNVSLPQGTVASLAIIPFGVLDLPDTNANIRALTIAGIGGIPIALDGLVQTSVPTTFNLDLD
ncbi:hypothetical protein HYPSUDRAFT_33750 [Hypholoma sublateritium FD-334 SS-4]|uniref:Late embryogenesis abundant protein LEA-2 subgroup domain-containing protein n=1 Tax=Hypholoma sublateritium (strain FD-334 SS-4) TaxID=945553 RepID=A0A0D2LKS3_HYPSF|nr:hypothetical protein HYPSUDRAFT_33750 [Hypholoma sublateritium FD-334 SS-4]